MDEVADAPRARLEVPAGPDSGRLEVRLGGELDLAAVPDVQPELDRLLGLPRQPLRIDAAELEFLDSSGVAVLIRLANHFTRVDVVHVAPSVRRVLEVLGLGARLGLDGT